VNIFKRSQKTLGNVRIHTAVSGITKYRLGKPIPVVKILFAFPAPYKFKNVYINRFVW
jgi:hypothetical protein